MEENPYKSGEADIQDVRPAKTDGFMSFLKKVLIGFGILFGIIVILLIWAGFSTSETYGKFEDTAEPFINDFLNAQSPWNYEKSKPDLSKAWLEVTSDEDGAKLFNYFNKLGSFQSIETIEWQSCKNSSSTETGSIERCDYIVQADYENGGASIEVGLSFESEEVKLIQLSIKSSVFFQ